ncbi:MAG: DUF2059 domain-containing protein [Nitrospira sp.]|nr:DUF2059 domain-containing protein [Candidatus Manganitrophaceae bacterium]HIL35083.1 DUF2059 domain-containing protein [Candidatus Manganitrophaceae bacterium]
MRKTGSLLLMALALLFISHGPAKADEGGGKAEAVARQLIESSGADQFGSRVIEQMVGLQQKRMPDIPDQFWENFKAGTNPDDLVLLIIPIYVKHLSVEEMQAIIDFYKSPAGERLLDKLPQITRETMNAGRQWGAELRMEMTRKLQETDLKKLK